MSTLFAFLHHVAAFTLVSALAVEFVLIRSVIHGELAAVVIILLCAAMMARGGWI